MSKRQLLSLGLLSGCMLALEVAFTRAFSFAIWYHFAYLIIGVAQLGNGAAGGFLAARPRSQAALLAALPKLALLFSLSVLIAVLVMTQVAFDPLNLSREGLLRTALGMGLYVAVLLLLFFVAGLYISGAFTCHSERAHRLYFADLFGACLATLVTLKLMLWLNGLGLFFLVALLGVLVAHLGGPLTGRLRLAGGALFSIALSGLCLCLLGKGPDLPIPGSKELSSYLTREGAGRPERTVWDPAARLDLLPAYAPRDNVVIGGISPAHPAGPALLRRRATFDGTSNAQVLGWDGRRESLAFFSHTIVSAPYLVAPREPTVLCIGVGGGMDLLLGRYHGARHITGVELNGALVELLRGPLLSFSGGLASDPNTELVVAEGRSFLERAQGRYDVIQGLGVDNFAALASGAYVLSESYLYTVDAFVQVYDHLTEDGVFAWTRSVDEPPREMLRLVVLAQSALSRRGVTDVAAHLAIVGSATEPFGTLLMTRRPMGEQRLSALRAWADDNRFPLLLDPAAVGRGNTYQSYLREADPAQFWDSYRYDVSPVDDDRPFFYNYFRWGNLLERGVDGDVNLRLPIANVVLLTMLYGALLCGVLLVWLPLRRQRQSGLRLPDYGPTLAYFGLLGVGYIAVQTVLIQGLTLLIGYPTLAITVTIATMLGGSGLGSLLAPRLCRDVRGLRRVLLAVVVGLLAVALALRPLSGLLLPMPSWLRIAGAVALVAPLAALMGMPFPSGLSAVGQRQPLLVGWAWAINGVCAVLGSTLVVVAAMSSGFRAALSLSALAYGGALLLVPALLRGGQTDTVRA